MLFFCASFLHDIPSSLCDAFYPITPNLYYRSPHTILGSIQKVLKLHSSTKEIAQKLTQASPLPFQLGLGMTPHHAELACYYPHTPFEQLPIEALQHFQGLDPWPHPHHVADSLVTLKELGYQTIHHLYRFPLSQEEMVKRWPEIGRSLYEKLFNPHYRNVIPWYEPSPKEWVWRKDFEIPLREPTALVSELALLLNDLCHKLQQQNKITSAITVTFILEIIQKPISRLFTSIEPHAHAQRWHKAILPHLSSSLNEQLEQHHLGIEAIEAKAVLCTPHPQQQELFEPAPSFSLTDWKEFLSFLNNQGVTYHLGEELLSSLQTDTSNSTSYFEPLMKLPQPQLLDKETVLSYRVHPLLQERIDHGWEAKHYWLLQTPLDQLIWVYYSAHDQQFYLEGYFE